jgi:hypothetical protein
MDDGGNQTRQESRLDSARALRLSLVAPSFVESDGQITNRMTDQASNNYRPLSSLVHVHTHVIAIKMSYSTRRSLP